MLRFSVDSKNAFEICLTDVAQTQLHGKSDVHLEFNAGDPTGANENDSLLDLSFHIPDSNTRFNIDDDLTPAQVFHDKISSMIEVDSSKGPVVTFEQVRLLTPRGRYAIELCISFLHLQGFANAFKIQYSNIRRVFVLPKYNQPHTCVAISLDPPLQRGQTLYPYIVLQFETESVVDKKLTISEELWADKYKDRLEASYKGLIYEVFTLVLRGLSGAKVSRAKGFHRNHDGYAMKATLKAEEGLLYPLEKGFFFLGKAPTFILYKEIEYVVFQRDDGGSAMLHYFDLLMKHGYHQQHQFRNIRRTEYHKIHNFMSLIDKKMLPFPEQKIIVQNLKRSNPELSFKDVGRVLKMIWDGMTEEEKEPYEAIAQAEANKRS
ncbi:hypothetical protein J5N97_006421 [Dioscorea zingiberensis]|uniref:FACT complex subunit SSRP1 n=1 Tax=Dioscorea zingiberensis TaxID=325984 RepID=A0A9D5HSR0_9LILI|nr:hypothetical protein J5N97_006421 [Dioscorea zingiberensis]